MADKDSKSLFRRLTRLFRSGPVVKRKIRALDTTMAVADKTKSSGTLLFQKSLSPTYATITSNAYNLSERLMRYQDFCFSGDTLVITPDEIGYARIDDIVARWESGDRNLWTFSYDVNNKEVVAAKITNAKCNGVRRLLSVTLDDGSIIRCTPEHRFMLKDTTYVEAKDLKPGTALMSFTNHCVVSVVDYGESENVYDIEVKGYSNFALAKKDDRLGAQGIVIVHNCEMEYCLHEDTKIAIPGGYKTIKELEIECKNNPEHTFVVYAYDHNKRKIVPAIGKQARQTRTDVAYTVTFDNGKSIIGTPNHRLMKRDGTFCKIEDLKAGDAMMPFYRRDLFNGCKEEGDGYRWIYTMDRESSMNGWVTEHRIIGEMIKGSPLSSDEVVHHMNFIKYDNSIENLQVMTDADHRSLHATILNGAKWSQNNSEWVKQFKLNHSKFMTENNPAERKDITFGRILEIAERTNFNSRKLCEVLDTDPNVIKRRLRKHGYENFETFARAYNPDWHNHGWDNQGKKNPRYEHSITFDKICSHFTKGMSGKDLAKSLDTTVTVLNNRIKERGYKNFAEFSETYDNLKVVSVEYYGVIPLYDFTVDGYKNFATDTVISHNTPEIAAALDIYADETVASDEKGRSLHIYSDNEKIRELLEELFYNVLNTEFNLRSWARNLVKFGDMFLYNDVSPEHGVINAFPIPVNEIEREENYDRDDPFAVRYRWVTLGNRTLENWEVTHFRLLGNDMFLPYGSSIVEPARRIWRQLILIEDAMLVYRVVRAPERRVFYIDVANIPANEIPAYMEKQKQSLRTAPVVDRQSGRVDLRYNPLSVEEDYLIPVRGSESGTKIDTLAGGQNAAAVEDVAYIQKKLFAALKIPRAYLGYDDMLASKATLAQEDIRFSRTINVIQKTIIAELNKLAIIHLYAHGFSDDDLQNFTLRLSNPSTVAQQQKLELWRAKFEIAGSAPEGTASKRFLRKEIWGLNDEEIKKLDNERLREKMIDAAIEAASGGAEGEPGAGGDDLFGGGGGDMGGGAPPDMGAGPDDAGAELPPEENAGVEPEEEEDSSTDLLTGGIDNDDDESFALKLQSIQDKPVSVNAHLKHVLYNRDRRRTHGASKTHMPDFQKMTAADNKSLTDPHGFDWLKSAVSNPFGESVVPRVSYKKLPTDVKTMLNKMSHKLDIKRQTNDLISEGIDVQDEIDHSANFVDDSRYFNIDDQNLIDDELNKLDIEDLGDDE